MESQLDSGLLPPTTMQRRKSIIREQYYRDPHLDAATVGDYWRVHNALIEGHGHQLAWFASHHVVPCKDPDAARA